MDQLGRDPRPIAGSSRSTSVDPYVETSGADACDVAEFTPTSRNEFCDMQHGSRYASGLAPSESFVRAWPARRERNPQGLVAPRGKLIGGYVEYITTSRRAMALIVIAVGVYGLGIAFGIAAYATVTAASLITFIDFMHAHDWLLFAGSLIAWGAVCTSGWEL